MRRVTGLRWSVADQTTYSVSYRAGSRNPHERLVGITASVPRGVRDKLDARARANGTTISAEIRKALIFATGEYVV